MKDRTSILFGAGLGGFNVANALSDAVDPARSFGWVVWHLVWAALLFWSTGNLFDAYMESLVAFAITQRQRARTKELRP